MKPVNQKAITYAKHLIEINRYKKNGTIESRDFDKAIAENCSVVGKDGFIYRDLLIAEIKKNQDLKNITIAKTLQNLLKELDNKIIENLIFKHKKELEDLPEHVKKYPPQYRDAWIAVYTKAFKIFGADELARKTADIVIERQIKDDHERNRLKTSKQKSGDDDDVPPAPTPPRGIYPNHPLD